MSSLVASVFGAGRVSSVFTVLLATAVGVFGHYLHENDTMTVVDPTNGQPTLVRNKHHVFWISVRWWGLLFMTLGVLGVIAG